MTKKTTRKTTAKKTATKARAPRKGEDGTGMERQEGNGRNGTKRSARRESVRNTRTDGRQASWHHEGMSYPLDAPTRRRIACAASCDPRAVQRYLRGAPQRPTMVERIERAAAELGVALPTPAEHASEKATAHAGANAEAAVLAACMLDR